MGTVKRPPSHRPWTRALTVTLVVVATVVSSLAGTAGYRAVASGLGSDGRLTAAAGGLTVTLNYASVSIDKGQSITLTATATGGTLPYTGYTWYEGLFSSCAGDGYTAFTTSSSITISNTTNTYVCVNVTDSSSPHLSGVSPTSLVTVNSPLAVGSIGPAAALAPTGVIDNGTSVALLGSASGGTSPLVYSWYTGPPQGPCTLTQLSGTSNTVTVAPQVTTSYCYVVTDSSKGTPVADLHSAAVNISVDPSLVAGPIAPTGLYGDSGQTFELRANPAGGTAKYVYQWYSGASTSTSCLSDTTLLGTGKDQNVTPTASTSYCYSISDSSYSAPTVRSSLDAITVNATLSAGAISFPVIVAGVSPAIDSGTSESVTLNANPTGGALAPGRTYSYQWYYGNYTNCAADTTKVPSGGTSITYTAAPTSSLDYCVTVKDSNGTTAESGYVQVSVNPAMLPGAPTPAAPQIDAGQSVILTADPAQGTSPYTYQWFAGSSCTSGSLIPSQNGQTYTATAAGSYIYRVTDSSNGLLALGQRSACATAAATVVVNSDPVPLTPTISPLATIDFGQTVELAASVTPGTGTPVISYQWRNGTSASCSSDQNLAGQMSTTLFATPTALTTVHPDYFCFAVSDGSYTPPTELSATVLVTVNPVPVANPIKNTPGGNGLIDLGTTETVTLYSEASGGTGALSYKWFSGSFASCASDTNLVGTNATFTTPIGLSTTTDYCYQVTDSASPTESAETATAFLVTVEKALVAGAPAASWSTVDLGQYVNLTATASGGTGKYTYQWFTGNQTCAGLSMIAGAATTSALYKEFPQVAGTTYFCYRVNDTSNGTPIQQSAYAHVGVAVTVYGTLSAGAITCYDNTAATVCAVTVPNGDSVTLTANPKGGNTAGYQYVWYSGPSSVCSSDLSGKISGQTTSTLTVTASTSPGTYYCYTVTDGTHGVTPLSSPTYFVDPSASASLVQPAGTWPAPAVAATRAG